MSHKATYVWDWTALLAYVVVGVAVILLFKWGLDWVAQQADIGLLTEGRGRRELSFIIATVAGLPLTRLLGKVFGLSPQRIER